MGDQDTNNSYRKGNKQCCRKFYASHNHVAKYGNKKFRKTSQKEYCSLG